MSADTNSQLCEIWGKCVYQLLGTSCIKFCFHQTTSELLLYSKQWFHALFVLGKGFSKSHWLPSESCCIFFPKQFRGKKSCNHSMMVCVSNLYMVDCQLLSSGFVCKKMFFPFVHLGIVSAGLLFDYLFSSHVLCLPIAECKLHQAS